METRLSGSAFQILAAANGKARLPTVESLKGCVLPLFDSTLIKKFKLARDNCVKLSHRAALCRAKSLSSSASTESRH